MHWGVHVRCSGQPRQGRDLFIKAKPSAKTNNLILVTERRRFAIDLRAVDRGGLMRLTLMPPKTHESVAGSTPTDPAGQPKAIRVATSAPDPQKILQGSPRFQCNK